jgi:hypothetical protein
MSALCEWHRRLAHNISGRGEILIIAGIATGCAFLAKTAAALLPPVVFLLSLVATDKETSRSESAIKELMLFALTALGIAGLYFIPVFLLAPGAYREYIVDEVFNRAVVGKHHTTSSLYYVKALFLKEAVVPRLLLVGALGFSIIRSVRGARDYQRVLIWALTPPLAFSLLASFQTWYVIFAYPAICLLSGALITELLMVIKAAHAKPTRASASKATCALVLIAAALTPYVAVVREIRHHHTASAERIPLDLITNYVLDNSRGTIAIAVPALSSEKRGMSRIERFYIDKLSGRATFYKAASDIPFERVSTAFVLSESFDPTTLHRRPLTILRVAPYHHRRDNPFLVLFFDSTGPSRELIPILEAQVKARKHTKWDPGEIW